MFVKEWLASSKFIVSIKKYIICYVAEKQDSSELQDKSYCLSLFYWFKQEFPGIQFSWGRLSSENLLLKLSAWPMLIIDIIHYGTESST